MQPNLQPPRLMLHSSMSAGTKEEAVGEGQWDPSALTLNHCIFSGLGFWMDKSKPSWDRGSAPQGISSSATSPQLCQLQGDKGQPHSWCPQGPGRDGCSPSRLSQAPAPRGLRRQQMEMTWKHLETEPKRLSPGPSLHQGAPGLK